MAEHLIALFVPIGLAAYILIGAVIYWTMPKDNFHYRPLADLILLLLCACWPITVVLAYKKHMRDRLAEIRREDANEV